MTIPAATIREAGEARGAAPRENEPALSRYYQTVFIWMNDPATFARYLELAAPVVGRYGGALERMLAPDAIVAEGMRKPDVVNIVSYDSREAFAALDADPEFQTIVPLRSASIDMAAIHGVPIAGTVTQNGLRDRIYLVEVAQLGSRGARGYGDLEAQAEPTMRQYGYHVERVMSADAASGFPFTPDLVKVASFDSPDGMERWHRDPAHQRLERELYPAAVQQSIWVVARVHPMTLGETPQ